MKISLFQGILFGVFGLAAVIGIFVFATHTGSTNGGKTQTVGTVLIWGTLPKASMQDAIVAAGKVDNSLKNVSYIQKDPKTLPNDLASAIATGKQPDLILASQAELQSIEKLLVPIPPATLSPASFSNAFVSGANIFAVPNNGGYYGVPFVVDPLVLYANQNMLASNGIAKTPATWEALTGLVPNIATLTPNKQITNGLIALGTYNNITNAQGILSSLFLQTGIPLSTYANGSLVGKLNGSSAQGNAQSGPEVLNFYTQFADPSKVSYTWNASLPNSQQAFLSGNLALYLGYVSEASFLHAANPNLNFAVSPFPQLANNNFKSVYGKIYAFMIPRGAGNASGAYQAAVRFSTTPIQNAMIPVLGVAPASRSALAAAPTAPIAHVAYAEALYTNGWLSPAAASTDQVFSSMINSVVSGRLSASQALTQAENALTALFQQS